MTQIGAQLITFEQVGDAIKILFDGGRVAPGLSQSGFEQAAAQYSEDQSNALKGGELGRFDRNRMVAPFTEVAFSLPVGEISEPVRTDFGYHLIEVLDQQADAESGEVYEVEARHILLRVNPGPATLDLIQQMA